MSSLLTRGRCCTSLEIHQKPSGSWARLVRSEFFLYSFHHHQLIPHPSSLFPLPFSYSLCLRTDAGSDDMSKFTDPETGFIKSAEYCQYVDAEFTKLIQNYSRIRLPFTQGDYYYRPLLSCCLPVNCYSHGLDSSCPSHNFFSSLNFFSPHPFFFSLLFSSH